MAFHFLTFADRRLRRSADRIKRQALRIDIFDSINVFDETDLPEWFISGREDLLRPSVRGFGYWSWKPVIIKSLLDNIPEGDCVLYADAGCHINVRGKRRLLEYLRLIKNSKSGVVAFQANPPNSSNSSLEYDGRPLFNQYNYEWVKGDVFEYFGVRDIKAFTHSQAIGAGIVLIRKCQSSLTLISEWQDLACRRIELFDDSPSLSPNLDGFIEHRHDQAVFTLLCLKYGVETLSAYEYWYPKRRADGGIMEPDWEALAEFPLHAKRDKDLGFIGNAVVFKNRVLRKIGILLSSSRKN